MRRFLLAAACLTGRCRLAAANARSQSAMGVRDICSELQFLGGFRVVGRIVGSPIDRGGSHNRSDELPNILLLCYCLRVGIV